MPKNVTVPALVQAGFEAVEEHGLSGLTMRDVAQRLGVRAPALYWHVKNRRELVDEMATEMWRSVYRDLPVRTDADPLPAMTVFARAVRRQALARRDGARLMAGSYLTDDDVLQKQSAGLRSLPPARSRALVTSYTLVYSFVIGYVVEEQARLQQPAAYDPSVRAARVGDPDPTLSALVLATGDDRFEELLALVIETVRRELLPGPTAV